jgi:predicted aldo/keto reductase-like oxidoreductase
MDGYLHRQLERLATNRIDYYLLHALDGNQWDRLEGLGVAGFLEKALAEGRIINAGFSFHGAADDFRRIVDAYPWTFCQIQYNFLDEELQAGTAGLKYAASKGLGVIVMEPLRGGNLAKPPSAPALKAIWEEAEIQRPPVEWALRWVWNHPEVTVVLSGMNEESHVAENLAIAEVALPNSLTEKEREIVQRAAHKYRELMKVDCTGCGYCMPCPAGVMIPAVFETYNHKYFSGNEAEASFLYALRMSGELTSADPGYASQCIECGECVEKCPQQLKIPELLTSVVEEFEGPDLDERVKMAKAMLAGETPAT